MHLKAICRTVKYTWWCIHSLRCSSTLCELHSASPIYEPSFGLPQRLSSVAPPWISWIIRARQKERVKGQEMLSLGRTKRGGSFLRTCQALRIIAEMLVCWRQPPGTFSWRLIHVTQHNVNLRLKDSKQSETAKRNAREARTQKKRQQDQLKKQKQGVKAAACCRERSWARDRNKLLTFSCPCLSWGAEIRRASRLPPSSCWRRSSPPRGLSASPPPSSSPPGAFASAAQTCRAAEMEEGEGGDGQTGRGRREEIWGQTGKRKETRR